MKKVIFLILLVTINISVAWANGSQEQARDLLLSIAEAVEQSQDCDAMASAIELAVSSHEDAIDALVQTSDENSGALTTQQEQRLQAAIQQVTSCKGSNVDSVVMKTLQPLGEKYACEKSRQPTLNLESESDCENGCCLSGWQTWATVTWDTAACLAGDE